MDNKTKEQRSYNMSQIRSRNTKPEDCVAKYLFSKGLRYRRNVKKLPGQPDIVLKKYKTVVFVNGCFWHGHDNCKYYSVPKTNIRFWSTKIQKNKQRDIEVSKSLEALGWKIIVVWECEIRTQSARLTRLNALYEEITAEQ